MTACSQNADLAPIAYHLAQIIDASAGDYPLVSMSGQDDRADWTWMYANLMVSVAVGAELPVLLTVVDSSCVAVQVRTSGQAIAVLRMTESIRQKRASPYIQLEERPVSG
ncbi:hypothetical protein D3C86_1743750 [compost metagenome]